METPLAMAATVDPWQATIGLIVVAIITVGGSIATTKIASRNTTAVTTEQVDGQIKSAQTEAEKDAFTRAAKIYQEAIDEQQQQIASLRSDLSSTRQELSAAKREVSGHRGRIRELESEIESFAGVRQELVTCRADLNTAREEVEVATRLVQQFFPDEPID